MTKEGLSEKFSEAELSGDGIFLLIPQRPPMTMVDSFYGCDEDEACCGLTVKEDNLFCIGGRLTEPGIVEHAAQSVAAMVGYGNYLKNLPPDIGYIGEVKSFRFFVLPEVGDRLRTVVKETVSVQGTTLASAKVYVGKTLVAEGQIKFSLKDGKQDQR
ncbi:MAG: hydroxymyristoyl-ACP dehydratase [Bacteroidales bacterium]|nr:hydroxymyristoyl-ACP dehydratase [Bacteroidales bacterium]MBQ6578474.1 hydroxymyristoyl-ACP dehydratase [Bacteroidales bacterium]